jgi:hypothetical protein
MTERPSEDDPGRITVSPTARYLLLGIGWFFLGLGAIGAFLPVLPTVPFLLITAWAWSKSSRRLHAWLYGNPTYGPYLVAWDRHGVIPRQAKIAAIGAMAIGWVVMVVVAQPAIWIPVVVAIIEIAVGIFILTRPSEAPSEQPGPSESDRIP